MKKLKKLLFRPLRPKPALVLSVLLLLAAFHHFWVGVGRPLPTAGLAFRLAAAQSAYAPQNPVVLDDGDLPLAHGTTEGSPPQRRYLSMEGDRLVCGVVTRYRPLSWTGNVDAVWPYYLDGRALSTPILLNPYTAGYAEPVDGQEFGPRRYGHEGWYALGCADPAAARISVSAAYQYVVSRKNAEGGYDRVPAGGAVTDTAECTEAEPGSGVWLFRVLLPQPERPAELDAEISFLDIRLTCVAYDASGMEIARSEY